MSVKIYVEGNKGVIYDENKTYVAFTFVNQDNLKHVLQQASIELSKRQSRKAKLSDNRPVE